MPQVPDVSFPTIVPGGEPGRAPQLDVDISGLKEQAGVGNAISEFGNVIKGAGDKFFATAQKFQQMRNDATANDFISENLRQKALDLEEFRTLQGKNASPEALNAAFDKMERHRQELLAKAPNMYVAHAVNVGTRSTDARVGVQMADWAGAQTRKALDDSFEGAKKLERNAVMQSPFDDDQYKSSLDRSNQISIAQSKNLGQYGETAQAALEQDISRIKEARITGMIPTNLDKAKELFEAERGTLDYNDIKSLEEKIRTQEHIVIPAQVAQAVTKGYPANFTTKDMNTLSLTQEPLRRVIKGLKDDPNYRAGVVGISRVGSDKDTTWVPPGATGTRFGESKPPMEANKYAIGKFESGGNYDEDTPSINPRTGKERHALGKYGIMDYNLSPWLREAGMRDMTPAQFKNNPAAQEQLFEFKFGQYLDRFGTFNRAAAAWIAGPGAIDNTVVHDRFGTTVPIYLRNVNANLANWAKGGVAAGPPREVDLAPINPTTGAYDKSPEAIADLDRRMQESADRAGIPIEIGPNGHYSLPKDYDVGTAPKPTEEPMQQLLDRTEAHLRTITSDPVTIHNTLGQVASQIRLEKTMAAEAERRNHDTLWSGIIAAGGKISKLPELISDPTMNTAYQALPDHIKARIQADINAYNNSLKVRTDPQDKYFLQGLWANNHDEFMKIDPFSAEWEGKLSAADIQWVVNQQKAIAKAQPQHDPKIQRFFDVMGPRLAGSAVAAMIDRNAAVDSDKYKNYYRLAGAYQAELEGMPDKGKNLTTEQIQKIGDALIYQKMLTPQVKGEWGGWNPFNSIPWLNREAKMDDPRFIAAGKKLQPEQRDNLRRELQEKRGENATITEMDIDIEAARKEIEALMPGGPPPGAGPARMPGR